MRLPSVVALRDYIPMPKRVAFTRFNVFLGSTKDKSTGLSPRPPSPCETPPPRRGSSFKVRAERHSPARPTFERG